jgi:aryl-alcohol dehydrogenase-like predicted oxidoreductase
LNYRQVGNSGLWLSEISYGTYLNLESSKDQKNSIGLIRTALEQGITTFDTADSYSKSTAESILGVGLKGVTRSSYEIMTKVFWPTGPSRNERGLSRKHIFDSVNESLKRLKTDYIDLYQAHHFDSATPLEEIAETFSSLIDSGKVRYIGVSNWDYAQLRSIIKIQNKNLYHRFISNQIQLSLLTGNSRLKGSLYRSIGISQIAWSPLGEGVLTGKYPPGGVLPNSRASKSKGFDLFLEKNLRREVLEAVGDLSRIAASLDCSPAQLAIAWLLQSPNVSSVVVGASKPEQIVHNALASGKHLDRSILKEIEKSFKPIREGLNPIRERHTPRSMARNIYYQLNPGIRELLPSPGQAIKNHR